VSAAANERRLRRIEGTSGTQLDEWVAAVHAIDRERRAALTLAKLAQDLVEIEPPSREPVREESPPSPDHPPVPPPRSGRRPWGPGNRPGVHDVLTPEQVLQLEWIDSAPVDSNPCLPPEHRPFWPKGEVAPYPHGNFIFPSYARGAEDAADDETPGGEA
jgi:hypothetical protein